MHAHLVFVRNNNSDVSCFSAAYAKAWTCKLTRSTSSWSLLNCSSSISISHRPQATVSISSNGLFCGSNSHAGYTFWLSARYPAACFKHLSIHLSLSDQSDFQEVTAVGLQRKLLYLLWEHELRGEFYDKILIGVSSPWPPSWRLFHERGCSRPLSVKCRY